MKINVQKSNTDIVSSSSIDVRLGNVNNSASVFPSLPLEGSQDSFLATTTSELQMTTGAFAQIDVLKRVFSNNGIHLEDSAYQELLDRMMFGNQLPNTDDDFENYLNERINFNFIKQQNLTKSDDIINAIIGQDVAVNQGCYTKEEYARRQQASINTHGHTEGIVERVSRFYNKDLTQLSPDEQKQLIKRYTNWAIEEAKKSNDPVRFIQRDLVGLITSAKPEHEAIRRLYFEVLTELVNDESFDIALGDERGELISNVLIANIRMYSDENARSSDIANANIPEILIDGDCSSEQIHNVVSLAVSVLNEEDVAMFDGQIDTQIAFYIEEHQDILNSIADKYAQAEESGIEPEFTQEEQLVINEIYVRYPSLRTGETVGLYNNENVSEQVIKDIISENFTSDSEIPNFNESVIEKLSSFIQGIQDISQEVFARFMDEATNGNYSKILDIIKNGTNNSLNAMEAEPTVASGSDVGSTYTTPVQVSSSQSETQVIGALGFNQTVSPPPEIQNRELLIEESPEIVTTSDSEADRRPVTIYDVLHNDGNIIRKIIDYTKEVGFIKATADFLDCSDRYCRDFATGNLSCLGEGAQRLLYSRLTTIGGRTSFIENADASLLTELEAIDSRTTELKEERIQELARRNGTFSYEA